jgi:hypothetical protein
MHLNARRVIFVFIILSIIAWLSHMTLLFQERLSIHHESQRKALHYIENVCDNSLIMQKLGELNHCESSRREVSIPAWELALLQTIQDGLTVCGEHRCDTLISEIYAMRWWLLLALLALIVACGWIFISKLVFGYQSTFYTPLDPRFPVGMPFYAGTVMQDFVDPVYHNDQVRLHGRNLNHLVTERPKQRNHRMLDYEL